ncbi:hypothetical protein BC830DRAFT_522010 [Chytriomyces sp. MP71]|nr:hypothetical protein BC830DRAFT_522010 [Chytriomyces sp. MP71]
MHLPNHFARTNQITQDGPSTIRHTQGGRRRGPSCKGEQQTGRGAALASLTSHSFAHDSSALIRVRRIVPTNAGVGFFKCRTRGYNKCAGVVQSPSRCLQSKRGCPPIILRSFPCQERICRMYDA